MRSFVMPPININASHRLFLFIPQILGIGSHVMINYSYSWERNITLKEYIKPFAIAPQGHAGKIRLLDVAIVGQKLSEMELNRIQY